MPRPRRPFVAVLTLLMLLALPAVARATDDTVDVQVNGGENQLVIDFTTVATGRNIHVSGTGGMWTINEDHYPTATVPTTYPMQCTRQQNFGTEDQLNCDFGATTIDRVVIYAGDGPDQVLYTPSGTTPGAIHAEEGADFVLARGADDEIWGDGTGPDNPMLDGADTMDGGCGIDIYHGGGNADTVSYRNDSTCRSGQGVIASLDDTANDGTEGEDIGGASNSVENVEGTDSADVLTGLDAPGSSEVWGRGGVDVITGGGGSDTLHGNDGADELTGGDGNDVLIGDDPADSSPGDDTIHADDGTGSDTVQCGGGAGDSVHADPNDTADGTCENVFGITPTPPQAPGTIGAPTGTVLIGNQLTADTSGWGGTQPITFTYTWARCLAGTGCTGIPGATASTYTIAPADAGWSIKVHEFAHNAGGDADAFSAETTVVPAPIAPNVTSIDVSGDNHVGGVVSALGHFTGTQPLQTSYVWYHCDGDASDCTQVDTGLVHNVVVADVGHRLKVRVSVSGPGGSASLDHLFGFAGRPPSGACTGLAPADDEDGDGLSNFLECNAVTITGTDELMDLPTIGANPRHKDVFVEVDAMKGHALLPDAYTMIEKAFAEAPVTNPDGQPGIALHIDYGPAAPTGYGTGAVWGTLSRATTSLPHDEVIDWKDSNGQLHWDDYDAIKQANFDKVRAFAFHYVVAAHQSESVFVTNGGVTRGVSGSDPGQDILITLGGSCREECNGWNATMQAGDLMHELGHSLGLDHGGRGAGGPDPVNYKPNYPSIMNYPWTYSGVRTISGAFVIDYSRYGAADLNTIDESALDESQGVTATNGAEQFYAFRACGLGDSAAQFNEKPNVPIDWDCSRSIDAGPVSGDVNSVAGFEVMEPHNDWTSLVYSGGAIGGAAPAITPGDGLDTPTVDPADATPPPDTSEPSDPDQTRAGMVRNVALATGDTRAPLIGVRVKRPRKPKWKPVTVRITMTDRRLGHVWVWVDGRLVASTFTSGTTFSLTRRLTTAGRHRIRVSGVDAVGHEVDRTSVVRLVKPRKRRHHR